MSFQVVGSRAGHWVSERHSKYQWPADKITNKEMSILHDWRKRTGTPINYLLCQAIQELQRITK